MASLISIFSKVLLVVIIVMTSSSLFAAELYRKQTGTATIAAGATSVTVTISNVAMDQSFLIFSATCNNANPGEYHIGGTITNSTTLTFSRFGNATTTAATIKWQVFEFESCVRVLRGVTNFASGVTLDVAIPAVTLAKSFVIATMTNDGATADNNDGFGADLTSTTNLRFTAGTGTGNFTIYWQVVEYQDAVVKKFTTTLSAGTANTTTTISPAVTTLSKAFVLSYHSISAAVVAGNLPRTELTNTTTVTYTRGAGTTAAMAFVTYVVEFTDATSVVTGTQAFGSGSITQNVAITATNSTGIFGPGNEGRQGSTNYVTDDNFGYVYFTYDITSATNLTIARAVGTGSTANAPYQLVTFPDSNPSPTPATYYSLASGAWEANTSWSFSADGSSGAVAVGLFPRRLDNVVIKTGHTITIDNATDNGLCAVSPDGLARSNVGAGISPGVGFNGSNSVMFYHIGDISIIGTLNVTSGVNMMVAGYTRITSTGVFTLSSYLVNVGYLLADASSTLTTLDDLSLTGNSTTIINTNVTSADDLNIDFTNATLCGTGTAGLLNSAGSAINYTNGGTVNQICTTFTVTCSGGGCSGFPVVGTGPSSLGNTGPAGVGSTDGTSELKVWLDASQSVFSDAGVTPSTDAGVVQQWNDLSGSSNHATKTVSNRPSWDQTDAAINNAAAVDFTAASSTRLNLNSFTLNPSTSSFSVIAVLNADASTGTNQNILQQKDASGTGRTLLLYDNALTKITTFLGNVTTAPTATYTLNTWNIFSQTFSLSGTTSINLYKAGTADGSATITPESTVGAWLIGASKAENASFFQGSMGELIILNQSISAARRIIIENYLHAKYFTALTLTNDVYTMDNAGNGNFDFEVAGIGQASDGSNHKDAKGPGVVRMWNPNGLANSEFLMWGHDNTAITSTTTAVGTAVDGTIIKERLSRIWRAGETGDVGTVSVSFDFSGVGGSPLGSNLRLLIDRDGDGFADNDVAPLVGSTTGSLVVFSNVNFQNGDRFTLGNTDNSIPLPIELLSFKATVQHQEVKLTWSTASEHNNDYFVVEKSDDAESWTSVAKIKGAGTSISKRDYSTVDEKPFEGVSYYRLRQVDFDKKESLSKLVSVSIDKKNQVLVYPNPSSRTFTITSSREILPEGVRFVNTLGHKLGFSFESRPGEFTIDPGDISPGVYFIQILTTSGLGSVRVIRK